jgi:hypothetical protein
MKLLSGRSNLERLGSKGIVHPGRIRRETSTSCCRSHPTPASLSSIEQEEEENSISDSTSAASHHTSFIESQWFRDRGEERASPLVNLFRFWHDEKKFKGNGENSLAQRALLRLGGQRTGGHVKGAPSTGPLGHQRKSAWDVLWSPSSYSQKCFEGPLRSSAVVSAVPGTQCLTKKKRLSQTLFFKWGDKAWDLLMPRTFSLPSEVNLMMEWTKGRSLATPTLVNELWMLKTAQHLGRAYNKSSTLSTSLLLVFSHPLEEHEGDCDDDAKGGCACELWEHSVDLLLPLVLLPLLLDWLY